MSSSSLAISSRSSALRWAIGLTCPIRGFFWIVVISSPSWCLAIESVIEVARPGGRVDAGLDPYPTGAGLTRDGGGELTGAQVADDSFAHRQHALVADAHAAAARHEEAGLLGLLQDGAATVAVDVDAGPVEGDRAALAGDQRRHPELLGEQGELTLLVVRGDRVEQPTRTAGGRRALGEVGDDRVDLIEVEDTVLGVVPRDEPDDAGGLELAQVVEEHRLRLAGRDVQHGDVVPRR